MIKKTIFEIAKLIGIDAVFRYINKSKVLVVMYHGITEHKYEPAVWTQLPLDIFVDHLSFLKKHYNLISLKELVSALSNNIKLPDNAALITFDDGLKNNFTVAFPVLQKMKIPSAVYLTVDLIGTSEILWFDELFLIINGVMSSEKKITLPDGTSFSGMTPEKTWDVYFSVVNTLKRSGPQNRLNWLCYLRSQYNINRDQYLGDFGLLDWNQVSEMERSGLVEFGVHTATHRILSELNAYEWEEEILKPKLYVEKQLGHGVTTFCYPNGIPNQDFGMEHVDYLRQSGFECAFTTDEGLFSLGSKNKYMINRIPAGNDMSSFSAFFRLNTSGFTDYIKRKLK